MAQNFDNDKLMTLLDPSDCQKDSEPSDAPPPQEVLDAEESDKIQDCDDQLKEFVQIENMTLPVIHGKGFRGMPAVVALSAVFPSFRRPKDELIEREIVGIYDGHLLTYESGHALNVFDEEIVLALFKLFSTHQLPLNNQVIKVKLSDLTRLVGKSHGGKNNAWVLSRLKRLRGATFSLTSMDMDPEKDKGSVHTFTILSHLSFKEGNLYLALDPRWAEMFASFPISLIYTPMRMLLNSAHARVIHRILSTSNSATQRLSESRLIKILGWTGTRKRDFWTAVKKASDELLQTEVISHYEISKSPRGETLIIYVVNHDKLKPGLHGVEYTGTKFDPNDK